MTEGTNGSQNKNSKTPGHQLQHVLLQSKRKFLTTG